MIQMDELAAFYVSQYRTECKKKIKTSIRQRGFMERAERLRSILRRAKPGQMTYGLLEEYHRQIKNLAYFAMRSNNPRALGCVFDDILPQLARLDLALFLPEQEARMNRDFLDYAGKKMQGEICRFPLFDLFQRYKRYYIETRILQMVPSRPEMEFPEVLEMGRHFILHIGPTNSGKTYQALERLKAAQNGVYLGPLRLLALEVYERMNGLGVPCTMLTGQECIVEPKSRVTASTVEMADFEKDYDIVVIDEAQMVSDSDRGHSWTRAILGIKSPEIHVCMSPAAEKAVTHLIGLCGDNFEIRRYERKTALVCEDAAFDFPGDVEPGDALVVFSKKSVLDVAGRLEELGIEASVIYGSLPPEIRRRQMRLFLQGETEVVVATDAIGMGLNLPVRRIVFIQTEKFDGNGRRGLSVPEIKQIAGRAGRFGIYDVGYVNAMGSAGLEYIRERFDAEEEPINTVSLGFPQILLDLDEPMDAILKIWHSVDPEPPFEKVSIEETLVLYETAEKQKNWIDGFDDKQTLYKMISCPIDIKEREVIEQWLDYCKNYSADAYLEHPRLQGSFCSRREAKDKSGIRQYEIYYKKLDLYYQFSRRFGKTVDEEWLDQERSKTEARIMQYLSKGKSDYIARCQYCGRLLPVGYRYRRCSRCMERFDRREHGGGHYHYGRGRKAI